MSFTVVVVPEDDRNDRYVLEPVLAAALRHIGKGQGRIRVVSNPRPRGVETVIQDEFFEKVVRRYGMAHLYLYCVDRDGRATRDQELRDLVSRARKIIRPTQHVDGRTAHQEVEVWALAPYSDRIGAPWNEVREERDPKERFFDPLVRSLGMQNVAGGGRESIGRAAGENYTRLRQLCPELQEIEEIFRAAAG